MKKSKKRNSASKKRNIKDDIIITKSSKGREIIESGTALTFDHHSPIWFCIKSKILNRPVRIRLGFGNDDTGKLDINKQIDKEKRVVYITIMNYKSPCGASVKAFPIINIDDKRIFFAFSVSSVTSEALYKISYNFYYGDDIKEKEEKREDFGTKEEQKSEDDKESGISDSFDTKPWWNIFKIW